VTAGPNSRAFSCRATDLHALIANRMRLVRLRTMVGIAVHAIALNYRLTLGSSLFTRRGLASLHGLLLSRHTARRREESLELLTWLDGHIDGLDAQIATAASGDREACRLMTHPGVGLLTALATILVLVPRLRGRRPSRLQRQLTFLQELLAQR
jgi:transposase